MKIGEFWKTVVTLCLVHNMRVTSGPRSSAWNAAVGGTQGSLHMYGFAADLAGYPEKEKPAILAEAKRLGLWVLDEGDHLHMRPLSMSTPAKP